MGFRFKQSNCTVVGTFNVHLVQHRWLAEVGLVPKGKKVRTQSDLRRPGFRLQIEDSPIEWRVYPDRLVVESTSSAEDCGTPVEQVLSHLRWTPVMAVGFNFVFTASEEEGEVIIPPTCCLPTHPNLPLGAVLAQRTTHVGIRIEETLYNLQLSGGIDGWELLLNVHREIDGQPGLQDANELARGACASFLRHRTTAMELATTWLAQELPL